MIRNRIQALENSILPDPDWYCVTLMNDGSYELDHKKISDETLEKINKRAAVIVVSEDGFGKL